MSLVDRPDELIEWSEECEIGHINWLKEFEEKVWPVYEAYGFTFPEAVSAWQMNIMVNHLQRIKEHFDDE